MEIVHQLGSLFLNALPTSIVVLLFYFFMRWAFFTPIQKAMAERSSKIEGARKEAAAVEAAAQQELDTYNVALRKARSEIYAEQEAERQVALEGRAKLLKAMRARAQEDVAAAKAKIDAEFAVSREALEAETPELAGEIVRLILGKPSSLQGGAGR